jgi:hypothetical protein
MEKLSERDALEALSEYFSAVINNKRIKSPLAALMWANENDSTESKEFAKKHPELENKMKEIVKTYSSARPNIKKICKLMNEINKVADKEYMKY